VSGEHQPDQRSGAMVQVELSAPHGRPQAHGNPGEPRPDAPAARTVQTVAMIDGAHLLLYSKDPDADRAFRRDVLQFRSVDVGHGWLIFALPPSELAVHPGSGDFAQANGDQALLGAVLYLMCDDLHAEMESLRAKNVTCSEPVDAGWGIKTTVRLPSGG